MRNPSAKTPMVATRNLLERAPSLTGSA
jgi:hypothetical protein